MRRNIRIQVRPATAGDLAPLVFSISFSYPDQVKAQAAVRELTTRFTEVNAVTSRAREEAYRGFWNDISGYQHTEPAPPPPTGEIIGILDSASMPVESPGPRRIVYLAWGLGAGLLLGLLAVVARQVPRGAWQLGGFALAGCALAAAASFLISDRYTSTATIQIDPAQVSEDPLAPLASATPAAEFLRQMEPQILSSESLSGIIRDPRLNLYPDDRARRPMEEVVQNMRRDIRIAALNPASGTNGAGSAFSISFSYSDKYKAVHTVWTLINAFDALQHKNQMSDASKNFAQHLIDERKAGENLDIVDTASLPVLPDSPDRPMIAAAGLGIGLLFGLAALYLRRPRAATLQPA
jgi:hypothetical protein